jgi:hypothetical protein
MPSSATAVMRDMRRTLGVGGVAAGEVGVKWVEDSTGVRGGAGPRRGGGACVQLPRPAQPAAAARARAPRPAHLSLDRCSSPGPPIDTCSAAVGSTMEMPISSSSEMEACAARALNDTIFHLCGGGGWY